MEAADVKWCAMLSRITWCNLHFTGNLAQCFWLDEDPGEAVDGLAKYVNRSKSHHSGGTPIVAAIVPVSCLYAAGS